MGLFSSIGNLLLGKKAKSESESKNLAYPFISETYSPQAQGGVDAFNTLGNALGIGGEGFAGQQGAYENFLNNSGYDYVLDQGMRGVTNSAAGKYLLRSGATAKALQDRSLNIGKTFFENYLDRIGQMSQLGLGAGGLIANAGQVSKGEQSGGSGGILGSLLQAAPAIFSDMRLKTNIEPVGALPDGLGVYEFDYLPNIGLPEGRHRGVMAEEVAKLRPWALGPKVGGFATVRYDRLEAR